MREEIAGALTALTATDDLITAAQGQGAHIRDILSTELAPYDVSRISMDGPECMLSPKLALTMALLVHELATNSAKYGALSSRRQVVARLDAFRYAIKSRLARKRRPSGQSANP